MTKYDFIILGILGFFAFIGFIRGFITELFEAGGIVAAIVLGKSCAVKVAPHLPGALPDYMRIPLATFVLSILIVFVIKAIGSGISKKVKKSPLKPLNSFLGLIMGSVKGMILIILILALFTLTPAGRMLNMVEGKAPILNWAMARSKPIIQNYGGKVANAAVRQVQGLVPGAASPAAPPKPITPEERAEIDKLLKDPTIKNLNLSEQELRDLVAKLQLTREGAAAGR